MYTNIPEDLVMGSIKGRWNYISKYTNIPMKKFLNADSLVFNLTYFKFDN